MNIPEGPTRISATDYDFRTRAYQDSYTVTIKSLGPGTKKGKIVFYNTAKLEEVYDEVSFDNLTPGSETSATLNFPYHMLSEDAKNLGVRILNTDEELDDNWPSGKFSRTELLPAWFHDRINPPSYNPIISVGSDEEDVPVPNTGSWTAVVGTASCGISITCIAIFIIASTKLAHLYRKK